jgi:hypothetical protein
MIQNKTDNILSIIRLNYILMSPVTQYQVQDFIKKNSSVSFCPKTSRTIHTYPLTHFMQPHKEILVFPTSLNLLNEVYKRNLNCLFRNYQATVIANEMVKY